MTANPNLRRLVIGQFISAIGDQFYLIALPWLALQITDSAFTAGTLLAVASVPRAVFMLVGGAVTDRISAKTLLIASNGLQAALMAVLGVAMLLTFSPLWFLYGMAFLTGLIDAFGLPAFNTMLPRVVDDDDLESGNVLLQGANMTSGVIGPALAGLLIAAAGNSGNTFSDLTGIGLAFLTDAATYVIGITFFWLIRIRGNVEEREESNEPFVQSMRAIVEFVLEDTQLKRLLGLMLVFGLFLAGTIRVGFPLLADRQLSGSSQNFGYMSSASGAGMLIGMAGVKLLPRPPERVSGIIILVLFALLPVGIILLGLFLPFVIMLVIIVVMGTAFGYVNIYLLSWLQRRTPEHLLGRMMAVVLFATIGLSPISQALMGALLDLNMQGTFIGVGSVILMIIIIVGANRETWLLKENITDRT